MTGKSRGSPEPVADLGVDSGMVQELQMMKPADVTSVLDLERDPALLAVPGGARVLDEQVAD
jgi:hypothetical protein